MTSDSDDLPGTFPGPIVRDFLYVDLARARSLLAQLANGRPDSITERSERALSLGARLNLFGFGPSAESKSGTNTEETRSLTDLHFTLFEEAAEAMGFLQDLTEEFADQEAWHTRRLSSQLLEGQMIRVTCPVRLVDSAHIEESLNRVDRLLDPWVNLMTPPGPSVPARPPATKRTNVGNQQVIRSEVERQRRKKLLGDLPREDMIPIIRDLMKGIFEDGISIRALACGEDHPDCAFAGTLLPRSDYIDPERSAIFSRLGVRPSTWTVVAIISRIPDAAPDPLEMPNGDFSRVAAEDMITSLLGHLERAGFTGSAQWPSIGIIPLAVYRTLPVLGG